jgi:hypothetical protein
MHAERGMAARTITRAAIIMWCIITTSCTTIT